MSGPPRRGETFIPPETTSQFDPERTEANGAPVREPNGSGERDFNPDETRPRSSFRVAGIGTAGGFESNPIDAPPHGPAPGGLTANESPADGGFSEPMTSDFGEPTLAAGSAGIGSAPPHEFGPRDFGPPGEFGPPTEFAPPPGSFGGPPPGMGYGEPRPGDFGPPGEFGPPETFGRPPGEFGPPPGNFGHPPDGFGGQPPPGGMPGGAVGAPFAPPGAAGRLGAPTKSRGPRARGPRRARLQLRHINPWTVLKFSCVLSVALFFVWLITIGLLYGILQAAGVIDSINNAVTTINGSGSSNPISPGVVFGGAAIIGVMNIVLFIALSTVGSVVYNLCADLVGGVEVTLSERD